MKTGIGNEFLSSKGNKNSLNFPKKPSICLPEAFSSGRPEGGRFSLSGNNSASL
jgi:hypothetical protein